MLVGISGKKQSGKDSVCTIIRALDVYNLDFEDKPATRIEFIKECLLNQEHLEMLSIFDDVDSKWQKHAFADKLKECAAVILGCDVRNFEKEEFKNQVIPWITEDVQTLSADGFGEFDKVPITCRKLLQKLGTEIGRSIDSNLWVNALFADYSPVYANRNLGVMQEHYWIIPDVRFWNEAETIKKRGGLLIRVQRDTTSNDTHPSETALDNYDGFDYIVYNNGSWDYFINQVIDIVEKEKLV